MATNSQLEKWCADIYALIDAGEQDVDALIRKHGKMSTLMALKVLEDTKKIIRAHNTVWIPGKRQFFGSPF
jgi:hypothetical protein